MACKSKRTASLLPPSIVRPVWADPLFLGVVSDYSQTDVVVGALTTLLLAPNNPNRWAIGFSCDSVVKAAVYLSPTSPSSTLGIASPAKGELLWYRLFDFGPMVSADWWAVGVGGATIRVHELLNY